MSTIRLGKININRSVRSYDTYVATICRSDSGFLLPYLATNTLEVETFYGSFPFKGMICKFIEDGVPVLLLPMITPMSETNRCTLRLNDTNITPGFQYAYPKCGRRYDAIGASGFAPPDEDVASGKKNYAHVIDFASVPMEALLDKDSYVITRIGDGNTDRVVVYRHVSEGGHDNDPQVETTYYDYRLAVDIPEDGGKEAFVKAVKDCANGIAPVEMGGHPHYISGAECKDIFDIMMTEVRAFLTDNTIVITEEDYDSSYGASDGTVSHRLYPTFDDYKEAGWSEARRKFRSWLAGRDYLLCDTMLVVGCCTSIFDDMSKSGTEYKEFDSSSESEAFLSEFEDRMRAVPGNEHGYEWYGRGLPYYSLCIQNRVPQPLLEFYNMEGFRTFSVQTPNMDIISMYTETSKVAEFVAKAKGSRGGTVSIGIKKVDKAPYCYHVSIMSGEYKEFMDVTTGAETEDYTHLSRIGELSSLVDAKLFNYQLLDGRYICSNDFDTEAPEGEAYDEERNRTRELPEGEWRLGRHSKEIFDYESACSTLDILSESEYYPDFLLVNELDYGSDLHEEASDGGGIEIRGEDRNLDYVKRLLSYAKDKSTQVMVMVDKFHYSPPPIVRPSGEEGTPDVEYKRIPLRLVTEESRMLYFNGCYRHNGTLYPCSYPYVINFLEGDFIKRLPYGVLYDVENLYDKEKLTEYGINYLEYDNYCYHYKTIREPEGGKDPDAIIRFVASKISRVFLQSKYDFVGIPSDSLPAVIGGKVSKAKSLLPILGEVTYGYAVYEDKVSITLKFDIPSLVNKEFKLNIILTTT